MRYAKGTFAKLPDDLGRGHLPSARIDASQAWQFVYRHAPVIGLGIAIAGAVL